MTETKTESAVPEGAIDLSEKGRSADGKPTSLNRRLFMQFMAFQTERIDELIEQLKSASAQCVIYQDANDPFGYGMMAYCEDPAYLVETLHPIFRSDDLLLEFKEEFTMLGRTYSIGYENDLEDVLLTRPAKRVCDPETPWAVYYPVRRSGMFERQSREDQRKMLMEHGGIGHAYGKAGYATDIRLAGHGLNENDNDFIIGLLGKELFPLSALVQHMRRTRQTSEFIESMGPFFVGRAIWQPTFNEETKLV
jgi:chlorite dismutase